MKLSRHFFATALAALVVHPALAADLTSDIAITGWKTGGSASEDYEFGTTQIDSVPCAYIKAKNGYSNGNGTLFQKISAEAYRGKRLRLSAQLKTGGPAYARLYMAVNGLDGKQIAYYGMTDRPVTGTTDWTRYDIVLDVPADAGTIGFGYILFGGAAWARDFKLEPVSTGVPVSAFAQTIMPDAPVNMDFSQ